MKMIVAMIPALVLAVVPALAQNQASPAAAFPTKIGLINVREAMMKTADGKKAAIDLEEKFATRRTSLQKRQIDMQANQDRLTRGGATMSDTAKAALSKEIDNDNKKFKRDVEDLNTDADEEQNKLVQVIWEKMRPVIQQYAMANNLAAVLDVGSEQSPVLWASNTVFIDDEIINLYNQGHPSSAAAPPAAAAPAKAPAPAAKKP